MSKPAQLAVVEQLRAQIYEVQSFAAAKQIRDKLKVLQVLLSAQAGWGDIVRKAADHRLRCERRMGELLPDRGKGGRGKTVDLPEGIGREYARELRTVAEVPVETFEHYLRKALDAERVPTRSGLKAAAEKANPPPKQANPSPPKASPAPKAPSQSPPSDPSPSPPPSEILGGEGSGPALAWLEALEVLEEELADDPSDVAREVHRLVVAAIAVARSAKVTS